MISFTTDRDGSSQSPRSSLSVYDLAFQSISLDPVDLSFVHIYDCQLIIKYGSAHLCHVIWTRGLWPINTYHEMSSTIGQ